MGRPAPGPVTAVVCAALDPAGEGAVLDRIGALHDAGLRVRHPPLHRPHVTLAAARVPVEEVDGVHGTATAAAARHDPFAVEFPHVGVFPRGGVLWLAPAPAAGLAALRALQSDVDEALALAGHERAFGATSDPGRWVPHCTLATRLDLAALGRAVEVTARTWRPVTARVEVLLTILVGRPGERTAPLG